jgi:Amt family ammonium transporter
LFSFTITFIFMKVLKSTVGIRITTEEEEAGIDSVSFGVKSYSNE